MSNKQDFLDEKYNISLRDKIAKKHGYCFVSNFRNGIAFAIKQMEKKLFFHYFIDKNGKKIVDYFFEGPLPFYYNYSFLNDNLILINNKLFLLKEKKFLKGKFSFLKNQFSFNDGFMPIGFVDENDEKKIEVILSSKGDIIFVELEEVEEKVKEEVEKEKLSNYFVSGIVEEKFSFVSGFHDHIILAHDAFFLYIINEQGKIINKFKHEYKSTYIRISNDLLLVINYENCADSFLINLKDLNSKKNLLNILDDSSFYYPENSLKKYRRNYLNDLIYFPFKSFSDKSFLKETFLYKLSLDKVEKVKLDFDLLEIVNHPSSVSRDFGIINTKSDFKSLALLDKEGHLLKILKDELEKKYSYSIDVYNSFILNFGKSAHFANRLISDSLIFDEMGNVIYEADKGYKIQCFSVIDDFIILRPKEKVKYEKFKMIELLVKSFKDINKSFTIVVNSAMASVSFIDGVFSIYKDNKDFFINPSNGEYLFTALI